MIDLRKPSKPDIAPEWLADMERRGVEGVKAELAKVPPLIPNTTPAQRTVYVLRQDAHTTYSVTQAEAEAFLRWKAELKAWETRVIAVAALGLAALGIIVTLIVAL